MHQRFCHVLPIQKISQVELLQLKSNLKELLQVANIISENLTQTQINQKKLTRRQKKKMANKQILKNQMKKFN